MSNLRPLLPLAFSALLTVARAESPVLTTADELARALADNVAAGTGFDLTARVSRACSRTSVSLGVWDDSGAAHLTHERERCDDRVADGDLIHVAGYTRYTSYGFANTYITNLQVLAHGEPPPVLSVTAADIQSGKADHRLVRTSGTLVNIQPDDIDEDTLFLSLDAEGRTVFAAASVKWNAHGELDALIGRRISVTGFISLSELNWRRRVGRYVSILGPDRIKPLADDTDRFAAPPLPTAVFANPSDFLRIGQRRASGRVLAVWNSRNLLISSPSNGAIRVELFASAPPAVGTDVEVVGFPQTDLFSVGLARASWRPAKGPSAVAPAPVATDLRHCLLDKRGHHRINMSLFGRLITVRGRVLPSSADGSLLVEDDGVQLAVDTSAVGTLPRGLGVDAVADFTGVFVVETENWMNSPNLPRTRQPFLVLRRADDIRLLSRARFWTSARLLAVLVPLLVGLVVLLIRSRITRARAELKAQERTRIAVELHDSLSQTLAGVSMEIATAEALRTDAPDEMARHLQIADRTLQSCRDELRNCLWDLRSAALDKPDLTQAILTTLRPHFCDGHLAVRFNVPRTRLSDGLTHAVLRIVRELALNACRHGNATVVRIAGCLVGGQLDFSVTDNGCGFSPDDAPGVREGHFGLQGIRERLDDLGGSIRIDSAPGRGTYVRVSLPPKAPPSRGN